METDTRLEQFPPLVLMATKINVLDLIDQLPLIPSRDVINNILAAPGGWHVKWHQSFDARPIRSWREFPANVNATLAAAGNWSTEQKVRPDSEPDDVKALRYHDIGVEGLTVEIKAALVGLTNASLPEEFAERFRNVHVLAKMQADALVEKVNTLTEDSPFHESAGTALAELVFAMSQAETYSLEDYSLFSEAPEKVQKSWTKLVGASANDEALALARALAVYRRLHGLGP